MGKLPESGEGRTLGENIAAAREAAGIKQGELAAKVLGSSRAATVSDWERGVRTPDTRTLTRIAQHLGVSVGYLLGKDEAPVPGLEPLRGEGMGELYRRWDQIEQDDCPTWLKALRQDVLVALVRADAMREEGLAARERAAALREEAAATRDRSKAVKAEAETSANRVVALQDGAPTELPTTAEAMRIARQGQEAIRRARRSARPRKNAAGE